MKKFLVVILILFISINNQTFASDEEDDFAEYENIEEKTNISDPLEGLNRKIFYFNQKFDSVVVLPIAKFYVHNISPNARQVVSNFINNIWTPVDIVASASHFDGEAGTILFWRFIINSTIGLLGTIDVASDMGLRRIEKNFAQTMEYFGIGEGPYLMIPLIGPSTFRDAFDLGLRWSLTSRTFPKFVLDRNSSLIYSFLDRHSELSKAINSDIFDSSLIPFTALDVRSKLLDLTQDLEKNSVDVYNAYKIFYIQNSRFKISKAMDEIKHGRFKKEERMVEIISDIGTKNLSFDDNDDTFTIIYD